MYEFNTDLVVCLFVRLSSITDASPHHDGPAVLPALEQPPTQPDGRVGQPAAARGAL